MLASCERTFEARHRGRLCSHALGNLCLSQARSVPCFQQQVEKYTFFSLNAFDFLPNTRPAHKPGDNLTMSSHA